MLSAIQRLVELVKVAEAIILVVQQSNVEAAAVAAVLLLISSDVVLGKMCAAIWAETIPMDRRVWKVERNPSTWEAMERVWPHLPDTMEDENYYMTFRVTKRGFNTLLAMVEGVPVCCCGAAGRRPPPALRHVAHWPPCAVLACRRRYRSSWDGAPCGGGAAALRASPPVAGDGR